METIIQILLSPIKTFLEENGLWDDMVNLYHKAERVVEVISGWFGVETSGDSDLWGFIVGFFKLLFQIIVTVFNVIIDLINWVLGLF